MPRPTTPSKVGKRLDAALRRKGVQPIDVMNGLGGRAIQTWYRWVNGDQEGGWKDIANAGLILGMTPAELMLEDEQPVPEGFNEDDAVQFETLVSMLREMTALNGKKSDSRPVAAVHAHAKNMQKLLSKS